MPTVIDKTYFENEPLFIPNAIQATDYQEPTAVNAVDVAIARYEKLLLVEALGIVQYDALIAALTETSGKWYDMLNGKIYNGKVWAGLKNENSLIAYYVYYHYLKNDRMQYTTVGLERSASKNATAINPTEKLTEVWNDFVRMYGHEGNEGWFYYPAFYWSCTEPRTESYVSLYKFLSDFPDDYDTTYFKQYAIKNRFGL
jgi:hypothetical protein